MPPGWRARRTPSTGGRTEATGSARAASAAGISPAITATATAIGTASAARAGEACRPSAEDSGSAAAAPSSPAVSPIAASSPSTVANSRGRVQPRQASTASSRRRPRTAVQRPAGRPVRRGGDDRLIRAERYPRQRVEFVDLRRVEDADELREGGEAGERGARRRVHRDRAVLVVLVVHVDDLGAAGVPGRRRVARQLGHQRAGPRAAVRDWPDAPVGRDAGSPGGRRLYLAGVHDSAAGRVAGRPAFFDCERCQQPLISLIRRGRAGETT
jgi:hypothetical protein